MGEGGVDPPPNAHVCYYTARMPCFVQCVTETSLFGLYGLWPRDLIRPPILGLLLDYAGSNHTKIAALAAAIQKSNVLLATFNVG